MKRFGTMAGVGAPVISIHGARQHNLKNLTLTIPRNRFVVVTGVSGSGKSTLAFDLLFAEGQRRFLDCMNTYARQFVDQLPRPDVDLIDGLPPTVSIEQRSTRGGGKSTVATVTEIYHFLRLLFARLGIQYCPQCNVPVEAQTRDQLAGRLRTELKQRGDLLLLAPAVKNRKGFHTEVAAWAAQQGYAEIRADGKIFSTQQPLRLDRFREHDVEIVVGVLNRHVKAGQGRAEEARLDAALTLGHGTLLAVDNHGRATVHSTERACVKCGQSFEVLDPKMFSYNSPRGWCPACRGFGELFYLPEVERGARAEDIEESWFSWQEGEREPCPDCQGTRLNPLARAVHLDLPLSCATGFRSMERPTLDTFAQMPVSQALRVFSALKWHGRAAMIARDILPEIRERLKFLEAVGLGYLQLGRGVTTLSGGESQRIRLAAQLGSNLSGVLYVLDEPTIGLHARDNQRLLAVLAELRARGNSLVVVEHDEETMRHADYIIDLGPGAGIRGGELVAGGTLAELLQHADSITGQCLKQKRTFPSRGERRPVTRAISLRLQHARLHNLKNLTVDFPLNRLIVVTGVSGSGKSTLIRECLKPALEAKLKGGSAKTGGDPRSQGEVVAGHEFFRAVYEVDQSPIGRTPRSVPATYVGFFDEIRRLFSQVPEARLRGYAPGRFSFNSPQGRCPSCEGAGVVKLEMSFLPPAFVRCETCDATRFNPETLDIRWNGKNIAEILDLTVSEAIEFFSAIPRIRRPLEGLHDTGLDYLKLGQTSPTLSGGEAQRLKLVTHLLTGFRGQRAEDRGQRTEVGNQKSPIGGQRSEVRGRKLEDQDQGIETLGGGKGMRAWELNDSAIPAGDSRPPFSVLCPLPSVLRSRSSLFLLEEPTIGLHIADVRRLVEVLQRLVDAGHSVMVIEHNLDLIAEADWVIDLGPEGGDGGGEVIATGTPEQVASNPHSHTGQFLRSFLRTRKSAFGNSILTQRA